MKVALIGDAHGGLDRLAACVQAAARAGAGAVIQLGDLGFTEQTLGPGRRWPRFPIPVLALCGNHEDHAFLAWARRTGLTDAWAAQGLCYQPRGSHVRLDGRTVVFLGGALHTDRPQDADRGNLISDRQVEDTLRTCALHPPDLIATHSCPAGIGIGMQGDPRLALGVAEHVHAAGFDGGPTDDCGEIPLRRLWDGLPRRPTIWAFGHFHLSRQIQVQQTRFVVLPEAAPHAITAWDTVGNVLMR